MFKRKSIKNLTNYFIIYCYEVTKVKDLFNQPWPSLGPRNSDLTKLNYLPKRLLNYHKSWLCLETRNGRT